MNVGKTFGAKAYTPGSIYQRSKQLGLINPNSNLKRTNRQTVEKNAAAVLNSSATIFNARAEQSRASRSLSRSNCCCARKKRRKPNRRT